MESTRRSSDTISNETPLGQLPLYKTAQHLLTATENKLGLVGHEARYKHLARALESLMVYDRGKVDRCFKPIFLLQREAIFSPRWGVLRVYARRLVEYSELNEDPIGLFKSCLGNDQHNVVFLAPSRRDELWNEQDRILDKVPVRQSGKIFHWPLLVS